MPPIHLPRVTLFAAGLLGLLFLALSAWVVRGRVSGRVMLGDGSGDGREQASPLLLAIRSHGNFAEYVPLCLILIGLLELRSGPTVLVKLLAGLLVLSRLAHPYGLARPAPNPFRAGGFIGTVLVLVVASLAALFAAAS